jgi:hypothetical protein
LKSKSKEERKKKKHKTQYILRAAQKLQRLRVCLVLRLLLWLWFEKVVL